MELSQNTANIYQETQMIMLARSKAKTNVNSSKEKLETMQYGLNELMTKWKDLLDGVTASSKQLEMNKYVKEQISNDDKKLRKAAKNIYDYSEEICSNLNVCENQMNVLQNQKEQIEDQYNCLKERYLKEIEKLDETEKEELAKFEDLERSHHENFYEIIKENVNMKVEIEMLKNETAKYDLLNNEINVKINNAVASYEKIKQESMDESSQIQTEREINDIAALIEEKRSDMIKLQEELKSFTSEIASKMEEIEYEVQTVTRTIQDKKTYENKIEKETENLIIEINEIKTKLKDIENEEKQAEEIFITNLQDIQREMELRETKIQHKNDELFSEKEKNSELLRNLENSEKELSSCQESFTQQQTQFEEMMIFLTSTKEATSRIKGEHTALLAEISKCESEIELLQRELKEMESQHDQLKSSANEEMLKVAEEIKSTNDSFNGQLDQSQRKIIETELKNKEMQEVITVLEDKLKDIKENLTKSDNLSEEYTEKMRSLDIQCENVSQEIKVVQMRIESKKALTPRVPYSHFPLPKKMPKLQKPKAAQWHDNNPGDVSDASTDGERYFFTDYIRRRNASKSRHSKSPKAPAT